MATDNIARGLSKRNEKVLEKEAQVIIDKAVDIKLNTIETDRISTSLNQSEEGFVTIENIKGKTIHNVLTDNITISSVVGNSIIYHPIKGVFKPNTQYTCFVNVTKNTSTISPTTWGIYIDGAFSTSIPRVSTEFKKHDGGRLVAGTTGILRCTFTSKETLQDNAYMQIGVHNDYGAGTEINIKDIMLLEGDWTNKDVPNYFQGIKSAGEGDTYANLMKDSIKNKNVWERSSFSYLSDGYASFSVRADNAIKKSTLNLRPSSTYTLVLDIRKNTYNGSFSFVSASSTNMTAFSNTLNVPVGQTGISKHKLQTRSSFSDITHDMWIYTGAVTSGVLEMRIMLLEGDWTDREVPEYFEGSKEQLKIKSIGKNLSPVKDANITLNFISNFGSWGGSPGSVIARNIPIEPNTSYNIKFESNFFTALTMFTHDKLIPETINNHNGAYTYIFGQSDQIPNVNFVNNKKFRYLTITTGNAENTEHGKTYVGGTSLPVYIKNLQVEKGRTSTEFSKYEEYDMGISISEPLRSLPNGICDEIIGDKLIRRVGKIVLNGSEVWANNIGWETSDYLPLYVGVPDRLERSYAISDLYPTARYVDTLKPDGSIGREALRYDSQTLYFFVKKSKLKTGDITGWKAFLSDNNITAYYELATPIETTISLPSLKSYKNGSIYLQNSVTPNVTIKYPTNLAGRVFMVEQEYSRANTSVNNYWQTLLILADRELRMKSIQPLTTNTTSDIKNKLNEIMNAWK